MNYDVDGININNYPNNQSNSFVLNSTRKPFVKSADERAIKVIHIREMDSCIFPILSAVCILTDSVKRK